MMLKPSPAPWRREDHKAIGLKILDAKGEVVAFLHYPQSLEQHANLRLLLRVPEVFERLKSLTTLFRAATMFQKSGDRNPALTKAEELLAEIESLEAPPKPPEKERL